MNKYEKSLIKSDCAACTEYSKAHVSPFCPKHRYCECDVAETVIEDNEAECVNCGKLLDPELMDYYNDLQAETKIEAEVI